MRYMRVRYYDNDFGWPVICGVKRLYHAVVTNNCDVMQPQPNLYVFNTHPNAAWAAFRKMYLSDNLLTVLRRMVFAEYIAGNQERKSDYVFSTIYDDVSPQKATDLWFDDIRKTYDYLRIDIDFFATATFSETWGNSENICLDLYSGACWHY